MLMINQSLHTHYLGSQTAKIPFWRCRGVSGYGSDCEAERLMQRLKHGQS
jgi:hypothetical protein